MLYGFFFIHCHLTVFWKSFTSADICGWWLQISSMCCISFFDYLFFFRGFFLLICKMVGLLSKSWSGFKTDSFEILLAVVIRVLYSVERIHSVHSLWTGLQLYSGSQEHLCRAAWSEQSGSTSSEANKSQLQGIPFRQTKYAFQKRK